jgi:hypothetical protein
MTYKTPIPIAALAAAALALPATAAASETRPWSLIPVPAGEVQHTVTETAFQSNVMAPGVTPWDRVQEEWVSATAARSVDTSTQTGELLYEDVATPTGHTGYNAETDTTFTAENPWVSCAGDSWQTEGSKIKSEIARGWLRAVGPTTYLGRPGEIYSGPAENGSLRMVIDDATGYPLEQAVSFAYGSQTGTQVSKVTTFEILSPAAAAPELRPGPHPGAVASRNSRPRRKAKPSRRAHGKPNKPTSRR